MHAPTLPSQPAAAAGAILLVALLAGCRAPDMETLQPQLAESLEAAYRQLTDPAMTEQEASCSVASAMTQALEGWIDAVERAGMRSRFVAEIKQARQRTSAIRTRCANTATAAVVTGKPAPKATSAPDVRPAITEATLDAYIRGLDAEIALMRANGTHFVSLSKYDEQGLHVAAKAGLPLPEYSQLQRAVLKVLGELELHRRYAGPEGRARLTGLEPHKREYAGKVLAGDPYASLSAAEREALKARLGQLQPQYTDYMELAAVGD